MFKFVDNKLNIAEVWGAGFKLFKQTFAKVWGFAFILAIIAIAAELLNAFGVKAGEHSYPGAEHVPVGLILCVIAVIIVVGLLVLYFKAVILDRVATVALTPDASASKSVKHVLSKYLILLVSMIVLICVILAAGGILSILFLLGKGVGALGLIIWSLFAVYISFAFMFNIPLILFEDKGAVAALGDSFKLVASNWWRNFLIFLVPGLIVVLVQILVMYIIRHDVGDYIAMGIISVFTIPYFQALILVQFNDLKQRSKSK